MLNETPTQEIDLKVDKWTSKGLDTDIQNKGVDFVQGVKDAEKKAEKWKIEEKAEAFEKKSTEVLTAMQNDIATNFLSIDAKKLQRYINAKTAFETDKKTRNITDPTIKGLLSDIQDYIDLKQIKTNNFDKNRLDYLEWVAKKMDEQIPMIINWKTEKIDWPNTWKMGDIITEIGNKKESLTEANKNSAINILANTSADKLFEKWPESDFKAVMLLLCPDGKPKKIESTTTNIDEQNFFTKVKTALPKETITSITIGQASTDFWDKFIGNTWLIRYGIDKNGKEQYMSRWTDAHLQELIAQKAIPEVDGKYEISKFNDLDRSSTDKGIYMFKDDNGNFWAFERFITQKGKDDPNYMKQYLPKIVEQIKVYEKITYKYTEDIKGDYIKDSKTSTYRKIKAWEIVPDSTTRYAQAIDKENTSLDGNFIKNGYADVLNDYMVAHPALMEAYIPFLTKENLNILWMDQKTRNTNYIKLINSRNSTGFRKELWKTPEGRATQKRLIDLQATILNQEQISIAEIASKWLDSLIKMFWSTFFNAISWLFWGKKWLLAAFPMLAGQINEIYKKEYGLSKDQVTAIGNISGKFSLIQLPTIPKTWKEIEELFDKTKYTALMMDEWTGYYKDINVNVFQKWLDLYDKDKKININDIVTITTDEKTQQQSITAIKDPTKFEWVMQSIVDSDVMRTKIAAANDEVQKQGKVKDYNEQGIDITKNSYGINTQQDIARYLTASLFSNKDLSYVMTENELKWKEIIQTPKIYTVSYEEWANLRNIETPTTKDEKWLKSGDTITAVLNKNGEEIRQSANNLKLKVTDIDAVKLDEAGLAEYYYKQVKTNDWKKRWIAENAITEKSETVVETPEQKFTKNRDLITGDKKFNNDKKLYGTFDYANKFIYDKDAKWEKQEYQTNILTNFEKIFTDKDQYPVLTANLNDTNKKATYEPLFTSPTNLANMLGMIDTRDNSTKENYKDAITNLTKAWDTYTVLTDKATNTITIKDWTWKKENWNITIKNIDGKLTADRKSTDAIASSK